jgi:hypothetical protein
MKFVFLEVKVAMKGCVLQLKWLSPAMKNVILFYLQYQKKFWVKLDVEVSGIKSLVPEYKIVTSGVKVV